MFNYLIAGFARTLLYALCKRAQSFLRARVVRRGHRRTTGANREK